MKARIAVLLPLLAVCWVAGRAQTTKKKSPDQARSKVPPHNSGPLTWIISDLNPNTLFWIQGRFIPVDKPGFQGDAEVATILCSAREYECFGIDGTTDRIVHGESVSIYEYKAVNWDKSGILATARSLDGCTDVTLKIRFSPPSVVTINSPVLPMSERCKKINGADDGLLGKGGGIAAQMEQDELVPTRGFLPFADMDVGNVKAPSSIRQNLPELLPHSGTSNNSGGGTRR